LPASRVARPLASRIWVQGTGRGFSLASYQSAGQPQEAGAEAEPCAQQQVGVVSPGPALSITAHATPGTAHLCPRRFRSLKSSRHANRRLRPLALLSLLLSLRFSFSRLFLPRPFLLELGDSIFRILQTFSLRLLLAGQAHTFESRCGGAHGAALCRQAGHRLLLVLTPCSSHLLLRVEL
jgi:hypothetical protein